MDGYYEKEIMQGRIVQNLKTLRRKSLIEIQQDKYERTYISTQEGRDMCESRMRWQQSHRGENQK